MYTKIKIKIKHIIPLVVLTLFVAIVSAQITPDPMPLNIRATNVFDTKFTISWTTNGTFTGAIKYGTDPKKLNNQVFDDRGDVEDDIHHVTVSGLNPNTTYYYSIVSGRKTFRTYNITTGPTLGIPRVPDTKYGRVFLSYGITPSNSSIVYISIGKSATISELVQNGYWMANFGDLRTADNSAYYNYKDYDRVNIFAQGASDGSGTITPKVKDCYSAPNIILSTAPIKVTHNFGVETRANLNIIKLINNPPSIKVIYPNGRENLSKRVTLMADARDTDGYIKKVEFQYSIDGTNWKSIGTNTTTAPSLLYTLEWNTREVANGKNYSIKAIATDNKNKRGEDTSDGVFEIYNTLCDGNCKYNRTFVGYLSKNETHKLDFIPSGASSVNITLLTPTVPLFSEGLKSIFDIDLILDSNKTGEKIVGPKGIINKSGTFYYNGMEITYSGFVGGSEYIKINKTTEILDLKVFGVQAGNYVVNLEYTTTPSISIYLDKKNYGVSELQDLGISATNPHNEVNRVKVKVWAETPSGGIYPILNKEYALTPLSDYNLLKFKQFILPHLELGNWVWRAQMIDPVTKEVISKASYNWTFTKSIPPSVEPFYNEIHETNINDTQFTISWLSENNETGYIEYGTSHRLGNYAYDDRGKSIVDYTHHVTARGLRPNTIYYYDIITGEKRFGTYEVKTGSKLSAPIKDIKTGRVFLSDGKTPAEGALVYVTAKVENFKEKSATISTLVNKSGYWILNFGEIRTEDNKKYYPYNPNETYKVFEIIGLYAENPPITGHFYCCSEAGNIILRHNINVTIPISRGWNLITLPVDTALSLPSASSILADIVKQGGSVYEIDRYDGGWIGYTAHIPVHDFDMEITKGYFVKSTADFEWNISGITITTKPMLVDLSINLTSGWNLIGVPNSTIKSASGMLADINSQGGSATEIYMFDERKQVWVGYPHDRDFIIERYRGYFVKCEKPSKWTPPS